MTVAAVIAALLLAAIHLWGYKFHFLKSIPRSRWLSMAGGASVAYIFVHILPKLQVMQEHFTEKTNALMFLEHHMYLIALLGLSVFYGVERAAKLSEFSDRSTSKADESSLPVFWVHIISFSIFNLLIGYLLLNRPEEGLKQLALFTIAMALHFLVNDHGLFDHYKQYYLRKGRWLLAATVVAGMIAGILTQVSYFIIGIIYSFIAGGTILNVLKEELPEERKSHYWSFLIGMVAYAALLLLAG